MVVIMINQQLHFIDIYYKNEPQPFSLVTMQIWPNMDETEFETGKVNVVEAWARSNKYEIKELEWY